MIASSYDPADILGGMNPSDVFIDEQGRSIMTSPDHNNGLGEIYDIDNGEGTFASDLAGYTGPAITPYYTKTTTWIISPRVRSDFVWLYSTRAGHLLLGLACLWLLTAVDGC